MATSTPDPNGSALTWLTGWITVIVLLTLLAKSSWGKPIVYYVAILGCVIIVLTHVDSFTSILSGFQGNISNGQQ
jgi:hypothetical protein